MNIFVLDYDTQKAAEYHCDKHCSKMILESAQLLSGVHRIYETPQAEHVYKLTHKNHPCAIWARESIANYNWLWNLYLDLLVEFKKRRGKHHKSGELINHLAHTPPIPRFDRTPFALAMPDEYKRDETVDSYRAYYRGAKADIAKWEWNGAKTPFWWENEVQSSNS